MCGRRLTRAVNDGRMPTSPEGAIMKLTATAELFLAKAERLVKDIKPLFADKHPAVIAMALAELVARHFASTPPGVRESGSCVILILPVIRLWTIFR